MTSRTPRIDFYAPKTLAVMDQAFAAIWNVLKADDPFRDFAKDGELRIAVRRESSALSHPVPVVALTR